jgi:hypothetical protein
LCGKFVLLGVVCISPNCSTGRAYFQCKVVTHLGWACVLICCQYAGREHIPALTCLLLHLHCCHTVVHVQYKLKVQPMSRAIAEGRAGNKALTYGSDSEDDEEGEGEQQCLW